jgi:serine/threonine-protein kinase HipA
MPSVLVNFNHQAIANLSAESKEEAYGFTYMTRWQKEGYAISPHLKLDNSADSGTVKRFLENLLPEGRGLETLLHYMHLSRSNIFGLIQAMGFESSGALSFGKDEVQKEALFRPVSKEELEKRIDEIESKSITIWDKKQRLSLAGVQEKLPVLYRDGELGLADGTLSSTHILKFQTQRTEHIVINEYYCMSLAKQCKLSVAPVRLQRYGRHPVLMVERFDRKVEAEHIERLHLIDGCQMLDLPPSYKYERNFGSGRDVQHVREGASFKKLFASAELCEVPAIAKLKLLDWAIFNLIIGNADAHGKNISYFVKHSGISVTPHYDLLSIIMHEGVDHELAMAFGDEFNMDKIAGYPLRAFCEETGLNPRLVSARIKALCKRVNEKNSNDLLRNVDLNDKETLFVGKLIKLIEGRVLKLMVYADEMLKVSWE